MLVLIMEQWVHPETRPTEDGGPRRTTWERCDSAQSRARWMGDGVVLGSRGYWVWLAVEDSGHVAYGHQEYGHCWLSGSVVCV